MKKGVFYAILVSLLLWSSHAYAVGSGGFENPSFSAASAAQGNAVVAHPEEPATISLNPAGILELPGVQVELNSSFASIMTFYRGDNDSGTDNTRSSATVTPIPTAYITVNPGKVFNDRIAFGFGSDVPFGFQNKYNTQHTIARYIGHRNWMKMYTLKPVMAVRLTDWFSVGAGPMNYRIFSFGQLLNYPNGTANDGLARLGTSGSGWGWQLGALAKLHKQHQVGFYFRSPVKMKVKGLVKVENGIGGENFETGIWSKLNLPLNVTVGYAYKPSEKTVIEADFGYTHWGTLRRLYINSDPISPVTANSAANDATIVGLGLGADQDIDYSDSFAVHLGGSHQKSEKLTLRGGGFFYWAAATEDHFKPVIPDANSFGLAGGLSYALRKNLNVDLAYLLRFWLIRNVNNNIGASTGSTVDGKYFSFMQQLFISMTYHWDDLFEEEKPEKVQEPVVPEIPQPLSLNQFMR